MSRVAIPGSMDEVDPAWLTAALRAGGALSGGASVVAARRVPAAGGIAVTSTLGRFALELEAAHAPASVIVKLSNPAWTHGPWLYEREVRFYRELAPTADAVPAPRCYYADYDAASGAFALVLEDLSDADPGHRLDGLTRAETRAALEVIARMHAAWWQRPALDAWPAKTYTQSRAERIAGVLRERWPALVADGRFAVSDAIERAVHDVMARQVDDLRALSAGPMTLIHADLHAENLLVDSAGDAPRVVAVDWQNASAGHCAFDVANVAACAHPDLIAADWDGLLDHYHAVLVARVAGYSRARLGADVAAAVRYLFGGMASWLVVFEAENLRDLDTCHTHWVRMSAALLAV